MLPCLFYAMLGNQTQDFVDGSGQSITELHPQLLLPPLPPPFGAKIKSRHCTFKASAPPLSLLPTLHVCFTGGSGGSEALSLFPKAT